MEGEGIVVQIRADGDGKALLSMAINEFNSYGFKIANTHNFNVNKPVRKTRYYITFNINFANILYDDVICAYGDSKYSSREKTAYLNTRITHRYKATFTREVNILASNIT